MSKDRLTAFFDAVLAIVMTVLVLSLKQPAAATLSAVLALHKEYLTYATSFFVLCITWHNLHNTFQVVRKINGGVLWANLLLLFVISFFPYVTTFVSDHFFARVAEFFFGIVFLLISLMYVLLCFTLHWADKSNKALFHVIYRPRKFTIYFLIQAIGFVCGYFYPPAIIAVIIATAVWIIPERRAEQVIKNNINTKKHSPDLNISWVFLLMWIHVVFLQIL